MLPALLGDRMVDVRGRPQLEHTLPLLRGAPGVAAAPRVAPLTKVGKTTRRRSNSNANNLLTTVVHAIRVAARVGRLARVRRQLQPRELEKSGERVLLHSPIPSPRPSSLRKPRRQKRSAFFLHEVFEWNWNADSEAMFDNELNIDFRYDDPRGKEARLFCEYQPLLIERQQVVDGAGIGWARRRRRPHPRRR